MPPTGAPGYKGEQKHWDKGFSADLDAETTAAANMGRAIEKKTGYVELVGRKEYTTPILNATLANLVNDSFFDVVRRADVHIVVETPSAGAGAIAEKVEFVVLVGPAWDIIEDAVCTM